MQLRDSLRLVLGVFTISVLSSDAFTAVTPGAMRGSNQIFVSMTRQGSGEPVSFAGDDPFDLEEARKKLESLIVTTEGNSGRREEPKGQNDERDPQCPFESVLFAGPVDTPGRNFLPKSLEDIELPPAPPLTSIERERRLAEIRALSELEHNDEALGDLWRLWFQERGAEAQRMLLEAEELTGEGPESWDEAEDLLCELIDTHGVYWAEPVNRLATLCYIQGRLEEAEMLSKIVLAVKPWHFGALSGLVMVFAGQHKVDDARRWASKRLPPVLSASGSSRRRLEWVHKATVDAQESLREAESRLLDLFGPADEHSSSHTKKMSDEWQ